MLKKKLLLAIVGIILLFCFFLLPRNRQWAQHVIGYYKDYPSEKKNLSREYRMALRFGNSYTISKSIADTITQRAGSRPALVLMPSPAYFKNAGIEYEVPEPAVFYYYTGCKTISPSSIHAIEANWYVRVEGKKVIVDSVIDREALKNTIALFNKWK